MHFHDKFWNVFWPFSAIKLQIPWEVQMLTRCPKDCEYLRILKGFLCIGIPRR